MKNIILTLVLCFTINNIKAQQFSGIYMQPSSPNDIVVNTAITNFVSNKMLKIDTYLEPNGGGYYFELTFLDDYLNPVGQSVRYGNNDRMMINDVKYDAANDCYVACGYFYNNVEAAFIINFDNTGMINWKTAAYNFAAQRGANEYRRVEICNLETGPTVYAVCGFGFTGSYERGIIGFYNQAGGLLSMYKSDPGSVYTTRYTEIVYNPNNLHLGLTGTFKDQYQYQYSGYLINEYDLTTAIPSTVTSTIRYGQSVEANGIAYDQNSYFLYNTYYYYISGSDVYNGNLFVSQTNLLNSGTTEQFYNTSGIGISDIRVSDNCINNSDLLNAKLGVTGYCINNGRKQGFMAEIDLFNTNFPILNFLEWLPNGFPFTQTSFQHIIYRDNMAVTPNYSYILYGLPQNPYIPLSYIAEYYPDPTYWHCADIPYTVNFLFGGFNHMPDPEISFPYDDVVPDFHITFPYQLLQYECNQPPVFSTLNHTQKQKTTLLNKQGLIKSDNGNIILNEDYTHAICNIYNISGQLIAVKEQGKQIINSSAFSNGIYLLQPIGNSSLKSLKFNITH